MDFDDGESFDPFQPSTSGSPRFLGFLSTPTHVPTNLPTRGKNDLSWEDEQAILRALTEDDDAGFAASLQNSSLSNCSSTNLPFFPSSESTSSATPSGTGASSSSVSREENRKEKGKAAMSLVDPQWEIIDPTPDIWSLFNQFNKEFFWGKLTSVEVKWSKQMTSCAGICRYQSRAGYCSIGLSFPLLKFRPRKDLIETLLHEMIHAYLFVSKNDRDRESHGPFFHEHMYRINQQTGTKISVYHSFHDEVNHYKQHIWRCEGSCRNRKPFNGFVKRAKNRAPSKNDFWWAEHQTKCGGSFVKIHEPEGFGLRKKRKAEGAESPKPLPATQRTLNDFGDFKSPLKSKEKPVKIDVKGLGKKLLKSPLKRQTSLTLTLTLTHQSNTSTTAQTSPLEMIDLTSSPEKKAKTELPPSATATATATTATSATSVTSVVTPRGLETSTSRRQLQLNTFFGKSTPLPPPLTFRSTVDPVVICLD